MLEPMEINEITEKIGEIDRLVSGIHNAARNYMRKLYSECIRTRSLESLEKIRNVARAFYFVGIIEGEFCDRLIRQAEDRHDRLQEEAAPEGIYEG